jgi:hypothetical protein
VAPSQSCDLSPQLERSPRSGGWRDLLAKEAVALTLPATVRRPLNPQERTARSGSGPDDPRLLVLGGPMRAG